MEILFLRNFSNVNLLKLLLFSAAIQAVQARAVIAQKRLIAYKKSQLPKPKGNVVRKTFTFLF